MHDIAIGFGKSSGCGHGIGADIYEFEDELGEGSAFGFRFGSGEGSAFGFRFGSGSGSASAHGYGCGFGNNSESGYGFAYEHGDVFQDCCGEG